MKSKYVKISISVLVFLLLIGAVVFVLLLTTSHNDSLDAYDKNIIILTENYPTDIFVIGEEILFRENANPKFIDSLTENELTPNSNNVFHFIVICDRGSELNITDEEFDTLKDFVFANNYNLVYIGSSFLDEFKSKGFFINVIDNEPSHGFQISYNLGKMETTDFWSDLNERFYAEDAEYLGKYLFEHMVSIIKPYYTIPIGY